MRLPPRKLPRTSITLLFWKISQYPKPTLWNLRHLCLVRTHRPLFLIFLRTRIFLGENRRGLELRMPNWPRILKRLILKTNSRTVFKILKTLKFPFFLHLSEKWKIHSKIITQLFKKNSLICQWAKFLKVTKV